MKSINISNELEMARLARALASNLQEGGVIELIGDLGSGKTTFTRYLVEELGGEGATSPSFTIANIYKVDGPNNINEVQHFDFYRLNEPGIMLGELSEALNSPGVIVVIEWAKTVEAELPEERLKIEFTNLGGNKRGIRLIYHNSIKYLVDNIE